MADTLTIVFSPELKALALQAFQDEAARYFSELPKPDPQFTVQQTAEILSVSPDTVRHYFSLPIGHTRHLSHIVCSDSDKMRRVRLSEIEAWQQRNDFDSIEAAARQKENNLRRARRRPRQPISGPNS